jgi:MATE family multidrug resistance protein
MREITLISARLLGTLIGLPIIFIMWHIGPILRFFHQQENLVNLTQHCFYGLALSVLPSIWIVCCGQFMIAIEKPRIVLFWNVLCLLLMLIPGYILVFGKFGLPKFGMAGMDYANAFMCWVVFIFAISYLLKRQFKHYQFFAFR